MHVTLVEVRVKPEHVSDFIAATRINHLESVRERGNRRFDVLQSPQEENRFLLYEAYVSAEAAQAHRQSVHYLKWRDSVAGWMVEPRRSVLYRGLFPEPAQP